VDGAEGVRHVHAALPRQAGHFLGQLGIVLGLPLLKAGVLQQQHLAGLEGRRLGLGVGAHHIGGHDDLPAQQLAQAGGHRLQGQLRQGFAPLLLGEGSGVLALLGLFFHPFVEAGLRLAHMGAGDHRRPLVQQVLDGGQGGPDTLVVRDDAAAVLGHGHVEVTAQQDLPARYLHVLHSFLVVVHSELLLSKKGYRNVVWLGPQAISPSPDRSGKPCWRRAS